MSAACTQPLYAWQQVHDPSWYESPCLAIRTSRQYQDWLCMSNKRSVFISVTSVSRRLLMAVPRQILADSEGAPHSPGSGGILLVSGAVPGLWCCCVGQPLQLRGLHAGTTSAFQGLSRFCMFSWAKVSSDCLAFFGWSLVLACGHWRSLLHYMNSCDSMELAVWSCPVWSSPFLSGQSLSCPVKPFPVRSSPFLSGQALPYPALQLLPF